jgi:hypothetical protein
MGLKPLHSLPKASQNEAVPAAANMIKRIFCSPMPSLLQRQEPGSGMLPDSFAARKYGRKMRVLLDATIETCFIFLDVIKLAKFGGAARNAI